MDDIHDSSIYSNYIMVYLVHLCTNAIFQNTHSLYNQFCPIILPYISFPFIRMYIHNVYPR